MYNYFKEETEDVRNYIENEIDFSEFEDLEELEQYLNDTLWVDDSVTGNASGSYTFNRVQASLYVLDNMDLLEEAAAEFGIDSADIGTHFLAEDWEWMDVTIRCYMLSQCIAEALEKYADKF